MSERTGPREVSGADEAGAPAANGAPNVSGMANEWAMGDSGWATVPGDEELVSGRTLPAFLVGVLAGLVVLALVWAGTAIYAGTRSGPDARAGADDGRVAAAAGAGSSAGSGAGTDEGADEGTEAAAEPGQGAAAAVQLTPTERCRRADEELAGPLKAAVPALDRWEIHVGAMNKLVSGAITFDQASAFWSQTRVGANRSLDRFYAAVRKVPFTQLGCRSTPTSAQPSAELRSCTQHVARERETLASARVAMGTWRRHVHDMAMLRMGHLSPTVASQMWLANWHRGVRELGSYRTAARTLEGARTC